MDQALQSYLARHVQGVAPKSATAVLELSAEVEPYRSLLVTEKKKPATWTKCKYVQ